MTIFQSTGASRRLVSRNTQRLLLRRGSRRRLIEVVGGNQYCTTLTARAAACNKNAGYQWTLLCLVIRLAAMKTRLNIRCECPLVLQGHTLWEKQVGE